MATEFDSGGGSKKRRMDEEGEQAAEEDRISALPEALQLHILGLLPFKSAIRTGALSTQWRALWTRRWPAPASLDFRLGPYDSPQPLLESLERRGRRRLDRLSLSFQIGQFKDEDFDWFSLSFQSFQMAELSAEDFDRCIDYAEDCAVADLDVHLSNPSQAPNQYFNFHPPPGNPHLARISLSGISVDHFAYHYHSSYPVLEVIHLHRVTVSDNCLFNLVRVCPLLRTLDIRYCKDLCRANLTSAGANLRNVTIVECDWLTDISIDNLSSLRSFRYSGAYIATDEIPASSSIEDLYICFGGPACRRLRSGCALYDARGRLCKLRGCWIDTLVSLSNLTVLTLCSSALRRVSAKARARSTAGNAASCKLQNLREVQLLMFAIYTENLDDIMVFLLTCCTPRLARLFVQLPTRSNQYKPNEEPSESEEDGSEEELSEVEASEEDLSMGEESEEEQSEQDESEEDGTDEHHQKEDEPEEQGFSGDQTKQDELEEEVSEEDHSQEDESEEDHSQEDESEEDLFREYESEEEHSQEDQSEEDHSQKDKSEEDCPVEDESEENGLAVGQSKEDESKKVLSDGGQSAEEPPGNGCENLMLLKMTNFMGHHNEMQLVSFVLKKSTFLNQLILFTPERVHPGGHQNDHLSTSNFLETKLLPLEKASPNAQITLSEPDAAAIKPLHSETFVKV